MRCSPKLLHIPVCLGILILLSPSHVVAQVKKGERLMNDGLYEEAAKTLKKDFFGKKPDPGSGYMLAQSYYQMKRYEDARDIMDLIQIEVDESIEMGLFYTDVLIANDAFSEAYLNVLLLLSKNPSDPGVYLWMRKVGDLLRWDSIPTETTIKAISGINTPYNEYAPFVSDDGSLWYVTDVNSMQSIFPASYSGQNIHLLYKTRYDAKQNDVSKPTMLVKNRKYYDHDGPLSAWHGHNLHAITMRDIDAPVETAPIGIYFIDLNKAADPLPFLFNGKHNTGHPSFTPDGSRMYFASDRPGGFGAMDIWYCDWKDGQWKQPVNLGPVINSPANEVFPRYYLGRLYLASDRRDRGYGGLDLYQSSEITGFHELVNMREPVNSAYDDFGVALSGFNTGFLVSNRRDGAGGDDIYFFDYHPAEVVQGERIARLSSPGVDVNTKVEIRDGYGNLVAENSSIEEGLIKLKGLRARESYTVKVKGIKDNKVVLELLNDQGEVAQQFSQVEPETFRVELLQPEVYETGAVKRGSAATAQFDLEGKLYGEEGSDWSATQVTVVGEESGRVEKVMAQSGGEFSVKGLPYGETFIVNTQGNKTPLELDIFGQSGAVIQSLIPIPGSNSFSYKRALPAADWMLAREVEVPNVLAALISETVQLPAKIEILDVKGDTKAAGDFDEDGFGSLGTMNSLRVYKVQFPYESLQNSDRLVLLDARGDTSQTVRPFDPSTFRFEYVLYGAFEPKKSLIVKPVLPEDPVGNDYDAEISNFQLPDKTAMVLSQKETNRHDTLYVNADGTLVLRGLGVNLSYELALLNNQLQEESKLKVVSTLGDVKAYVHHEDKKLFQFTLLDDQDYEMGTLTAEDAILNLFGKALSDSKQERMRVLVYNGDNELLSEGYTTSDGGFSFQDLPTGKDFILEFPDNAPTQVGIAEIDGRGYIKGKAMGKNRFRFDLEDKPVAAEAFAAKSEEEVERREFTVPHVYYNFNSYYLKQESRRSLDMLTRYLVQNPDIVIEIRSYTDCRGSDAYNQLLSERRANSVKEYLIGKGISQKRLETRGFGEKGLVNHCADNVACSEEEHAANRRTTFVILND